MSFNELIKNESLAGMKRLLRTVKKQETLQNNVPMTFYGVTSNPPSTAEINALIDTPANVGTDFVGLIVDNINSRQWLVWTDALNWYTIQLGIAGGSVFSGARLTRNGLQTIPNFTGTSTAIAFDLEDYDTDDYHDIAIDNDRLIVPFDGFYRFTAMIRWGVNATGSRSSYIAHSINGIIVSINHPTASGTLSIDQNMSIDYYMNSGEYVRLFVEQTSGGNLNIFSPALCVQRLG